MTDLLQSNAAELLQLLEGLIVAPAVSNEDQKTATEWRSLITDVLATLERHDYKIVFVGKVGVGKSSLISVLTELVIGAPPRDRSSLHDVSVLPVAAGRTTGFEIWIRESADEPASIGLELEPLDDEDIRRELRIFAESEWRRRRDHHRRVDDDAGSPAIETDRILRGMAGYAEKDSIDPTTKRRRWVRPLDEAVGRFSSLEEFSAHIVSRVNLDGRTQRSWTCRDMEELKDLLARINRGEEPTASLPERVTLIVPRLLPDLDDALRAVVVDTRGLDGQFDARADLRHLIRDPRALPILCSSFADAPDESMRALLRSAQADPSLKDSLARALLVLVDRDDASQVTGADGDRGSGQDLKIDECNTTLHNAGLSAVSRDQIVAVDLFKDGRERLCEAIRGRIQEHREATTSQLEQHLADARNFVDNHLDGPRKQLCTQVDRRLEAAAATQRLRGTPLQDPLQGALAAIRATRYASVVYASCRRNGSYIRLNVYAAVDAAATRAATEWLAPLNNAITTELERFKADPGFVLVNDHIRLREQQFQAAHTAAIRTYAAEVSAEVKRALDKDAIWSTCSAEWGEGTGFKDRVLSHLEGWSRRQQSITIHEKTDFATKIPFAELEQPDAPRFTLSVRNLRALSDVRWTPSPVSLLIGANGVGKTTLLDVLRLLRRAYEAGLAAAVSEVFHGSNNLRSRSAREDEPIEIGLSLGDYDWTIALIPREGTVEQVTHERLFDNERKREIFVRDSLGSFLYQGERLEATSQLGLRVLAEERRVPDPAVRGIASLISRISVFRDPDLWSLRENGSRASDNLELAMRGTNALAVLRRWADDRGQRHRFDFVLKGLHDAFPGVVKDIDFVQAGNTVTARIYRPDSDVPGPLADEANGVLQLLILLCDLASAEDGSLLAIDEPENGLHPYAVKAFLRRVHRWSRQHRVTVLLATHSLVLLDQFNGLPTQVYVLKGTTLDGPRLLSLAEYPDPEDPSPERLDGFKLGDLYEQGELGSNEDDA